MYFIQLWLRVYHLAEKYLCFIILPHLVVQHGQIHLGRIKLIINMYGPFVVLYSQLRFFEIGVKIPQIVTAEGEISGIFHSLLKLKQGGPE